MAEYDWSQFTKRIPIKATKQAIFKSWITQKDLESWFLRMAEFKEPGGYIKGRYDTIAVGDSYLWQWHGWPDEVKEEGEILELISEDSLSFSFGKAGIVTVSVKEEDGENILELTQTEIPIDEEYKVNFHLGCGEGWTFYMTNLKSILEGGIDLRNRNENLKKVINS